MRNQAHRKTYPGANGNRLTLDKENKMIWGVCAGAANYFGFDVNVTRVCTAIAGFMFFPTVPIIYAILSWVLDSSNEDNESDRKPKRDPDLSRRIRSEPHATLRSVRFRFRDLERRLQRLEKHVTSRKYDLERELDGLRD